MAEQQVVGIVGAGLSGLLACKYMLSKGFNPIVFESESSIGGVWTKTLQTTKLQTPKPFYQFSDFPWPESVTEMFPDHYQVLDYIESYARHFDLIKHIRFNSKVISAAFEGSYCSSEEEFGSKPRGYWNITVQNTQTPLLTEVHEVGFLILCVGRFSGVPNIPEFAPGRGPEVFQGKVMHSMDYAAINNYEKCQEMVRGKSVTIVGLQKSAMDIAMEVSTVNGVDHPCTVLYRTPNWSIPDYQPWGISLALLYLNRFSELLVHKPGESLILSLLATMLSPLRWGLSKFVESYIKWKLRLAKYGMVPKHSFLQELSSCLTSTVPQDFYDRVEKGSIKLKKAQSFGFCKEGILVDGEAEVLETDLVILATGFRGIEKIKNIFASPIFQDYITGSPDKPLPLYRQCVHPRIPRLAIIGFSESLTNLYTSEIRCRWVAELLDGKFNLPSTKEMEKEIGEWEKYMKQYAGKYYRRSCVGALHIYYNDQLYKDMGLNHKRKKGFIAELFEPYGPMDYAS